MELQRKQKKEAEIKAARVALLAIQLSTSQLTDKALGNSQLTVIPCRKRAIEMASNPDETTVKAPKPKKSRFKKKMLKTKFLGKKADRSQDNPTSNLAIGSDDSQKPESIQTDSFTAIGSETLGAEATRNLKDTKITSDSSEREMPSADVALAPEVSDDSKNEQLMAAYPLHSNHEVPDVENSSMVCDDQTDSVKLPNGDDVASKITDPTSSQMEASKIMPGLNQVVEKLHANAGQAQVLEKIDIGSVPGIQFRN